MRQTFISKQKLSLGLRLVLTGVFGCAALGIGACESLPDKVKIPSPVGPIEIDVPDDNPFDKPDDETRDDFDGRAATACETASLSAESTCGPGGAADCPEAAAACAEASEKAVQACEWAEKAKNATTTEGKKLATEEAERRAQESQDALQEAIDACNDDDDDDNGLESSDEASVAQEAGDGSDGLSNSSLDGFVRTINSALSNPIVLALDGYELFVALLSEAYQSNFLRCDINMNTLVGACAVGEEEGVMTFTVHPEVDGERGVTVTGLLQAAELLGLEVGMLQSIGLNGEYSIVADMENSDHERNLCLGFGFMKTADEIEANPEITFCVGVLEQHYQKSLRTAERR